MTARAVCAAPELPGVAGAAQRRVTLSAPGSRRLIGTRLYRDRAAAVRELAANAACSVGAAERDGLLAPGEALVVIRLHRDMVVIEDNGTGITAGDLTGSLAVLGTTSNADRSLPGSLGSGFFSYMMLGRDAVIDTELPDGTGYQALCLDGDSFTVTGPSERGGRGTTVMVPLDAMPEGERGDIYDMAWAVAQTTRCRVRLDKSGFAESNPGTERFYPVLDDPDVTEHGRSFLYGPPHPGDVVIRGDGYEIRCSMGEFLPMDYAYGHCRSNTGVPDEHWRSQRPGRRARFNGPHRLSSLAGIPISAFADDRLVNSMRLDDEGLFPPAPDREGLTEGARRRLHDIILTGLSDKMNEAAAIDCYAKYAASPEKALFRQMVRHRSYRYTPFKSLDPGCWDEWSGRRDVTLLVSRLFGPPNPVRLPAVFENRFSMNHMLAFTPGCRHAFSDSMEPGIYRKGPEYLCVMGAVGRFRHEIGDLARMWGIPAPGPGYEPVTGDLPDGILDVPAGRPSWHAGDA